MSSRHDSLMCWGLCPLHTLVQPQPCPSHAARSLHLPGAVPSFLRLSTPQGYLASREQLCEWDGCLVNARCTEAQE